MAKAKTTKNASHQHDAPPVNGASDEQEQEQNTGEQEDAKPAKKVKTVKLVREEYDDNHVKREGPLEADVHPDEVQNWLDHPEAGWKREH